MVKVKITMTVVKEYEVDHTDYVDSTVDPPRQMTEEEAIKCDEDAVKDDPWAFIDDSEITVKVERL